MPVPAQKRELQYIYCITGCAVQRMMVFLPTFPLFFYLFLSSLFFLSICACIMYILLFTAVEPTQPSAPLPPEPTIPKAPASEPIKRRALKSPRRIISESFVPEVLFVSKDSYLSHVCTVYQISFE